MRSWLWVAFCVGVVVLAGCGESNAENEDAEPFTVLEVVAEEDSGGGRYRFEMPDTVPAGPARVALVNQGDEDHHV
jgi:hypothetical protein